MDGSLLLCKSDKEITLGEALTPQNLIKIIQMVENGTINNAVAKRLIRAYIRGIWE